MTSTFLDLIVRTRFLPAIAATMLTAGALAVPSLAQESGDTPPSDTSQPGTDTTQSDRWADREAMQAEREAARAEAMARHDELLAGELGVSVEDLVAARDRVKEVIKAERREELVVNLNAKVADGTITQERADEILARFDRGEHLRGPRRGPGHGPGHAGQRGDRSRS